MQNRRRFIKQAGLFGLGVGIGSQLSACAYFDDKILGFRPDPSDKVTIIGGGLAGLTVAYLLRKRNIPFVMFEGSARFGGRVYTLQNINQSQQYAELGGEWIDDSYSSLFTLVKELKIPLDNYAGWNVPVDPQTIAFLTRMTDVLNQRTVVSVETWKALDAITLGEWLYRERDRLNPAIQQDIIHWTRILGGAEPQEISAAYTIENLLIRIKKRREKLYRIRGGASELIEILSQRSIGLVPESTVYFRSRLTGLRKKTNELKMYFQTPDGEKSFTSKKVICTLPYSQLRNVEGIEDLGFQPMHSLLMNKTNMGAQTKLAMGYKQRFWKGNRSTRLERPSITKDSKWLTWETSDSPLGEIFTGEGVLQVLASGEAARKLGTEAYNISEEAILSTLGENPTLNKSIQGLRNFEHMINWQLLPHSTGSTSFLPPGTGVAQRSSSYSDLDKMWIFAGEQTSRMFSGTLEGAIESARRAVGQLIQEET